MAKWVEASGIVGFQRMYFHHREMDFSEGTGASGPLGGEAAQWGCLTRQAGQAMK
jgi:hypothetical protein